MTSLSASVELFKDSILDFMSICQDKFTTGCEDDMDQILNSIGLLGCKVVEVLDYRPRGPRFQPPYSNREFFIPGVYSVLPQ